MPIDNNNLIWVDLEMTGLDPDRDRVIEIATIVTNASLAIVAVGPVIAIRQPDPHQLGTHRSRTRERLQRVARVGRDH